MLVSCVQHSDSVLFIYICIYIYSYIYICIHIYTHILFQILFSYRLLQNIEYSSLCYSMSLLFIYFIYSSVYMLISTS